MITDDGTDADIGGNLQMPMSTRHFGRTYLMSIRNRTNVMVVIDIFPQRTPSNSRPM